MGRAVGRLPLPVRKRGEGGDDEERARDAAVAPEPVEEEQRLTRHPSAEAKAGRGCATRTHGKPTRLRCLAESHLVCEDRRPPRVPAGEQPAHALLLVPAKPRARADLRSGRVERLSLRSAHRLLAGRGRGRRRTQLQEHAPRPRRAGGVPHIPPCLWDMSRTCRGRVLDMTIVPHIPPRLPSRVRPAEPAPPHKEQRAGARQPKRCGGAATRGALELAAGRVSPHWGR